jgi:hypothetical protein
VKRTRFLVVSLVAAVALLTMAMTPVRAASKATAPTKAANATAPTKAAKATAAKLQHLRDCQGPRLVCTEVQDSEEVFGEGNYVGHDEPSLLFYSNKPGSGTRQRYELTLPKDPPPKVIPGRSWTIQLRPTFWFGVAVCDTQSYPVQISTCKPGSDDNIVDPKVSPNHPGTAFVEVQFYPPGFVRQFDGFSCDATKWCAALTIDSLAEDPVNGTFLNDACQAVGLVGVEPVNFAYLTRNGVPQGPPDPVHFDFVKSGAPDPAKALFMNQGDRLSLTMKDTAHGLRVQVDDHTTGQSGFMVASAANGFAQVKYAPNPSTECTAIPYDFHPMYSTSSERTTVPWGAHTYNVAFSDEIGHFDYCTEITGGPGGNCTGLEGVPGDQEPADADDTYCFDKSFSTRYQISGCLDTNSGFDGTSYKRLWPDGNTRLHPTSVYFTRALTGQHFDTDYQRIAFEADLPRIEAPDLGGTCDRDTGVGCTLIPTTDDGTPADFYPFYSKGQLHGTCTWGFGDRIRGFTRNDFGGVFQYGSLLKTTYLAFGGHGATVDRFNNFHQTLNRNPCEAR